MIGLDRAIPGSGQICVVVKKKGRPVSRVLSRTKAQVLSFIWDSTHALPLTAYPPGSGEQPSVPGIFGLSTHKVYPLLQSPAAGVSPYLTFSPLPFPVNRDLGGYFLWHFLSVRMRTGFPLGSMLLCVARTFLGPAFAGPRQVSLPFFQRTLV